MEFSPPLPIRLLIVDDDPQIRAMLAEYLSTFGMQADGVGDGTAMRQAMAATAYDLVILDLSLPGENGLALCRELRAQSNVAVIMLTARAELADRVVGLHVSDWPEERSSRDRLLPGEGGARSREIVAALRRAGWQGSLDVEIFSTPDGFWSLPVDEAARRAYGAARSFVTETAP